MSRDKLAKAALITALQANARARNAAARANIVTAVLLALVIVVVYEILT